MKQYIKRIIPTGYYVYELQDPSTLQTFYVGKGKGRRMYQHERRTSQHVIPNGNNYGLYHRIKDTLANSGSIQYQVVNENMTELEAYALEDACIEYHGLPNLCNRIRFNKGCINRPSNGMLGKTHRNTTKSKQLIASIIQFNGNFVNYFEKVYQSKRQPALRRDLRLLNSVINDIRERLEREERKHERKKPKQHQCPVCGIPLCYADRQMLLRAIRMQRKCKRCAARLRVRPGGH